MDEIAAISRTIGSGQIVARLYAMFHAGERELVFTRCSEYRTGYLLVPSQAGADATETGPAMASARNARISEIFAASGRYLALG